MDLLAGTAGNLHAWEIKSGMTVSADHFKGLNALERSLGGFSFRSVVYGGEKALMRQETAIVPWKEVIGIFVGEAL